LERIDPLVEELYYTFMDGLVKFTCIIILLHTNLLTAQQRAQWEKNRGTSKAEAMRRAESMFVAYVTVSLLLLLLLYYYYYTTTSASAAATASPRYYNHPPPYYYHSYSYSFC